MTDDDQATTTPPVADEPGAALFVWTAWAAMLAGLVLLVARYGVNIPTWDDYDVVDVAIARKPFTPQWLWSQHNEHRVPLARLVLLGLDRLSGGNQRVGMFASVGLLAAGAAGAIRAARSLRGGTVSSDAALPVLILNPGQYLNLVWTWQVQFTLATSLTLLLIAIVATMCPGRLTTRRAWLVGLLLALLPLCGASGLVFVPFGVAWLLIEAFAPIGSAPAQPARNPLALAASALPGTLAVVLYLWDYHASAAHSGDAGLAEARRTVLQFLSLGLGPASRSAWSLAGGLVLAMSLAGASILVWSAIRHPEFRPRDLGLLAMLAASLALVAMVGLGRAGTGERAGLEPRYVTLLLPLMATTYLAFTTARRGQLARSFQMGMFLAVCIALWPNVSIAMHEAGERSDTLRTLEDRLAHGVPPASVIRDFGPALHPSSDELAALLPALKAAGRRPFDRMSDDEPAHAVSIPIEPSGMEQVERMPDGSFRITGVDPHIRFRFQPPAPVIAIRLHYDLHNAENDDVPARFVLDWLVPNQDEYDGFTRYSNWNLPTGDDRTTTVYILDFVREFRIQPDNRPGTFRIRSLERIVPDAAPEPPPTRPRRRDAQGASGPPSPADSHQSSAATDNE
jgi:hypothetical protein